MPGATATDLWENSGFSLDNLPKEIVMPAAVMVDAALSGLDQGEFMTAPSVSDIAQWESFEKARQALGQSLSRSTAAARYGVSTPAK